MIVIGVDSAEHAGVAVVHRDHQGERLRLTTTLEITTAADVESAVTRLTTYRPDLVAIEAPFVRMNPATALVLAVLMGRWLQEWERRGVATCTVLASVWQLGLLDGLISRRSDRACRKAAAKRWALATYGVELPEDEADAAGIAAWALRRARMQGKRAATAAPGPIPADAPGTRGPA